MATALRDDELWRLVEPLLPVRRRRFHHPGRKRLDDRPGARPPARTRGATLSRFGGSATEVALVSSADDRRIDSGQ
jgi:hypothetical protein